MVEFAYSRWPFGGFGWTRIAYTAVDTPLAGYLPIVGVAGVSFLVALTGQLVAWAVRPFVVGETAGRRRRLLVAGALVAVVLLGGSGLRRYEPEPVAGTAGTVTVGVVQGNVPGKGIEALGRARSVTNNHLTETVDLMARARLGQVPTPDFVLWPENSTAVDPFRDQETNAGILNASRAIGVPILVGAIVDAGPKHVLNQGIVWDPVTGAGDRYTKHHPVVFGEYIPLRKYLDSLQIGRLNMVGRDMVSGTRLQPLSIAGVEVADSICFDVAYDDAIYGQVSRGAQLLAVQTSNATFIHTHQIDQQFAITRLRAVETGRWLAVSSTNGVSGVIAPDGSVVASADPRTQAALVGTVGLDTAITPAVRIGPWSGRVCVVLTVLGMVLALVPYRRNLTREQAEDASVPSGLLVGNESRSE
jgi:apolipoprotein N-acyltransferase